MKEETRADFAPDAVAQAWERIKFTPEVSPELVKKESTMQGHRLREGLHRYVEVDREAVMVRR